jgi:YIF1
MSYYNNQGGGGGGGGGYYGGGQQQHQPPPYGGGQQQQQQQQQHGSHFQQSYNDPNAWQQQPAQQQQQQYSQQQPSYSHEQTYGQPSQQQQYPQPTSQNAAAAATTPFWNPATAANLAALAFSTATSATSNPDGMLDLAGVAGKSFLENSSARMVPGLERTMQTLRCYFAVDNRYVVQKIKRILLPFTCHQWKRQVRKTMRMVLSFLSLAMGSVAAYLRDVREYLLNFEDTQSRRYFSFLACLLALRLFISLDICSRRSKRK